MIPIGKVLLDGDLNCEEADRAAKLAFPEANRFRAFLVLPDGRRQWWMSWND